MTVTQRIGLSFAITLVLQVDEVDLKPNGSEIDVTERNRKEYVE